MLGQLYLSNNSPLGFYGGNVALVFAVSIGGCMLIGIAVALLAANDDDETPP